MYLRKDLRSPLTVASAFAGDKDREAAGLLAANSASNADLSTLASVVTTLVAMGRRGEDVGLNGIPGSPATSSGNSANGDSVATKDRHLISRAFTTMARVVVQSQNPHLQDMSLGSDPTSMGVDSDSESIFEFEGPLLLDSHVPFHLTAPSPMPAYLNVHYICESASRLLFLSVHWARSIPAFQLLSPESQTTLVRESWSELFALGLAQCSQVMSLATILTAIINHLQTSLQQDKLSPMRVKQVTDHICKLQDYVNTMLRLQVDEHEYAYLKAIVLFAPDHPALIGARQVEKFQDKAYQELRAYISQTFPDNQDRFPKLLLRLPTLRSLQPNIMEELFFAGLIGNVQIDSIIPHILRMGTNDCNLHLGGMSPSAQSVNSG